jgi:hypothetical protein
LFDFFESLIVLISLNSLISHASGDRPEGLHSRLLLGLAAGDTFQYKAPAAS